MFFWRRKRSSRAALTPSTRWNAQLRTTETRGKNEPDVQAPDRAPFVRDPMEPELTIEEPLTIASEDSHNPYDRVPEERRQPRHRKRDLRKLSEWIVKMRQLKGE